jgi:hypothetical protein
MGHHLNLSMHAATTQRLLEYVGMDTLFFIYVCRPDNEMNQKINFRNHLPNHVSKYILVKIGNVIRKLWMAFPKVPRHTQSDKFGRHSQFYKKNILFPNSFLIHYTYIIISLGFMDS